MCGDIKHGSSSYGMVWPLEHSQAVQALIPDTCGMLTHCVGGHSIDAPEPIFGLVVAGIAHPDHIRQNSTARAGDVLLLTKPLGIGAMTTAIKKGKLDAAGYKQVRLPHEPLLRS